MTETIYIVTHFQSNHTRRAVPIDPRFLTKDKNYVFYVVDHEMPNELKPYPTLFEREIDPLLHQAGAQHLAEWSFLLAEAKYGFCSYPLFTISSRFYEKNRLLPFNLDEIWDQLFSYFSQYNWAWLPSYDEPLRWINLSWENVKDKLHKPSFFYPCSAKSYQLIEDLYGSTQHHFSSNFFCNYIGFKSRNHLQRYVNFYQPLLDFFFDKNFQLKTKLDEYVLGTRGFYNEKPFTFLQEHLSHLFFYQEAEKFFGLRYDGIYEIDEKATQLHNLFKFDLSLKERLKIKIGEQWTMANKAWWTTPYLRRARQAAKILLRRGG